MARRIDISTPKYPDTWAIVDDEDYDWLIEGNKWRASLQAGKLVALRKIKKSVEERMHRIVTSAGRRERVIAYNGNYLDCRKENLRINRKHVKRRPRPVSGLKEATVLERMGLDADKCCVLDISTKLHQETVTIIDKEDYEKLASIPVRGKWTAHLRSGHIYVEADKNGKRILMHRVVADARHGDIVDHINGNTLDNRKDNLRLTDFKGNARNSKVVSGKIIPYKGVNPAPKNNYQRYMANITIDGQWYSLGTYATPELAAAAYNGAAKLAFGEFAKLNKLP